MRHTPDFFVIRTNGLVWEEWKHAEALPQLAACMPARYVQNADGPWRCPPGEAAAAEWGLAYHVRTSAEINWTVQRNLRFLEDYLRSDCPPVAMELATAVQALVQAASPVTLATLLTSFPSDAADAIYTLIATDTIHVDLTATPLVEPERVWVVPVGQTPPPPTNHVRPSLPTEGTTVLWDGVPWLVINVGAATVALS